MSQDCYYGGDLSCCSSRSEEEEDDSYTEEDAMWPSNFVVVVERCYYVFSEAKVFIRVNRLSIIIE